MNQSLLKKTQKKLDLLRKKNKIDIYENPIQLFIVILFFAVGTIIFSNIFSSGVSTFFTSSNSQARTYSNYFLSLYNSNVKLEEELDVLLVEEKASSVFFFLYTPDLTHRILSLPAGELSNESEFQRVDTDEIYSQQLEDHIYDRCSYFEINSLDNDSEYKQIAVSSGFFHTVSCPVYHNNALIGYVALAFKSVELPKEIKELLASLKFSITRLTPHLDLESIELGLGNKVGFVPPTSDEFRDEIIKLSQDFFNSKNTNKQFVTVYFLNKNKSLMAPIMRLRNNEKINGFRVGSNPIQLTRVRTKTDQLLSGSCIYISSSEQDTSYQTYLKSESLPYTVLCPIISGTGNTIGVTELYISETDSISDVQLIAKEFSDYIRDQVYLYIYLQ